MKRLIKLVDSLIPVEFDTGTFDDWCVYITTPKSGRFAPTDLFYFGRLKALAQKHSYESIYTDFVEVYERTGPSLDYSILADITRLAGKYGSNAVEMDVWLTVLYAGMIAEENKEKAVLKKKIKRLGMHQLLVDRESPEFSASFSRGKKADELLPLIAIKGF